MRTSRRCASRTHEHLVRADELILPHEQMSPISRVADTRHGAPSRGRVEESVEESRLRSSTAGGYVYSFVRGRERLPGAARRLPGEANRRVRVTTQSPTLRVNITVKRSTYTIGVTTHESLHVGGGLGLRWRSATAFDHADQAAVEFFYKLNANKWGDPDTHVPTKLAGQRLIPESAFPRRNFSIASPRARRHQRAHTGVERAFTSSVQSPPPYQEGHRPVLR